jgi:hypothetical protein
MTSSQSGVNSHRTSSINIDAKILVLGCLNAIKVSVPKYSEKSTVYSWYVLVSVIV